MKDGYMKHQYDLLVSQVMYFGMMFNNSFKPKEANPYRSASEFDRIKPEHIREDESKTAFKVLGRFLKGMKTKPKFKNLLKKD